ncbi:Sporulation and spore germination [Clostridium sp. DSM 8431]|uniref:GerMN domain-containing protein n=1 Tax=Clostridium sp. DSM 8431 TaxID=1761781 RepID=UPI0008F27AF4|nr:GerMN domain-containing protein [Clostridium sp. DSM 8431]SFU89749.1 Sporulation and spore germination [Clostridium sp. DSM 8431]
MKKALITLLLSTSLLFLIGCGNTSKEENNSVSSNGTTESSSSKTDNSEKNSNDDNTKEKNDNVKEEDAKNDKDTTESSTRSDSNKEESKEIPLTIYYPNDTADGLNNKTVTINHLTAYSIINALAENKVVPSGTTALKFDSSNKIGYLDVSSNIYNGNYGTTEEQLMLDSIKETFLKAFNLEKIKLTVNGSPYSGPHLDFSADQYL